MMPYLSTRLYVDLNLTPILESLLGVASYAGIAIRVVFLYQLLVKKSIRRQEYLVLRKFVCLKFFVCFNRERGLKFLKITLN